MASSSVPEMDMKLDEFCRRAAQQPHLKGKVLPQQFESVMSGIAVLYALAARKQHRGGLQVQTKRAFASELVPQDVLLREIGRCAGVGRQSSEEILSALEETLRSSFSSSAKHAALSGIATIEPIDLAQSRYLLHFNDLIGNTVA